MCVSMKNITKGKTVMIGQQKTLEIQILSFLILKEIMWGK